MSNLKEFKYMKKTDDVPEGYVYAPWITHTTKAFINNIHVWDHRWWKNILCKINWFLHFRLRKQHRHYINSEVKLGKIAHFSIEVNRGNNQ